jgi:hypothetical protein
MSDPMGRRHIVIYMKVDQEFAASKTRIAEYALGGAPYSSGPEISSKALYDKRARVFDERDCRDDF